LYLVKSFEIGNTLIMNKVILKPGRPSKGADKKVRVSMTLKPELALWVQRTADDQGVSASQLVENMVAQAKDGGQSGRSKSMWETRLGVERAGVAALCRVHGISDLALFGSVLRADFNAASDVDLLVRFKPGACRSLFDLARVKQAFEMLFGRSVDLVEEKGLTNPIRRQEILKERRRVYEADAA
jgi:uncharacterized protein